MREILFLCHRIPYPPDKGDKIRSYHLLGALAQRYRVHLGAFIDQPEDHVHARFLESICDSCCLLPLNPTHARIRSLAGLFRGEALSVAYYRNRPMRDWIARLMSQRPISAIVVFSSAMAQFATGYTNTRRILDLVDVDSEKWLEYAGTGNALRRWVYRREARTLLATERALVRQFDASVLVTEAEAQLFAGKVPECASRVAVIGNGVDSDYFDPAVRHADPYEGRGQQVLVFTGAMDYAANVDAVEWFALQVLPRIRAERPQLRFYIVGSRPSSRVRMLDGKGGVTVTGRVPDVRPYLAHAALAVAPMRIARGVQNKVLEALAMGRPLLLTTAAAKGLHQLDPSYADIADEPASLARLGIERLATAQVGPVAAARQYVSRYYSWSCQLEQFIRLIEPADPATAL